MIYSFDLSAFEEGTLVATRFPASCGVSGDWVCCARSDKEVLRKVADRSCAERFRASRTPRAHERRSPGGHRGFFSFLTHP